MQNQSPLMNYHPTFFSKCPDTAPAPSPSSVNPNSLGLSRDFLDYLYAHHSPPPSPTPYPRLSQLLEDLHPPIPMAAPTEPSNSVLSSAKNLRLMIETPSAHPVPHRSYHKKLGPPFAEHHVRDPSAPAASALTSPRPPIPPRTNSLGLVFGPSASPSPPRVVPKPSTSASPIFHPLSPNLDLLLKSPFPTHVPSPKLVNHHKRLRTQSDGPLDPSNKTQRVF
ncbi:hypothetical protein CROQUDRAFT_660296 [Cronartium quercuum f. sp. fusiforme G11]|uniref:Uncharacterized protein n=1 Tax=Cronartium quercuum f. sp. fusiforme G11 TaxID=708437 RepID=A0A9P6NDQ8_9BASI|nr:hypothetical protein CROQUDRAFT_660296 [Cronartium quercuum f. sp. fusiforme G11]